APPAGCRPGSPPARGGPPLPGPPPGLLQDHLQAAQQRPAPLLLQHPPAVLYRVVLAVVRRVVHQPYLQPRPVAELHHPPQPLRPVPPVVLPVGQIDHQALDVAVLPLDQPPSPLTPIRRAVPDA